MGSLIRVDEDKLQNKNIQAARFFVKTSYLEIPRAASLVEVDGKIFNIRIKEEIEDCDDECDEWLSNNIFDEDNDSWIQNREDREFSDGEGIGEVEKSKALDDEIGRSANYG